MDNDKNYQAFLAHLQSSLADMSFIKLNLSDKRNKKEELKSVSIKPVQIKKGLMLSFVYRYPTRDLTKNYTFEEALEAIKDLIEKSLIQAELQTSQQVWHLVKYKNDTSKLIKNEPPTVQVQNLQHDKQKVRMIEPVSGGYLEALGLVDSLGKVKPSMNDKFRQINKYIEIVDTMLRSIQIEGPFKVVDMGSGKGYLTFALYDYLINTRKVEAHVTGVEFRSELVIACNSIAKKCGFEDIVFEQGIIKDTPVEDVHMLIALHACDTATDEAIFKGISAKAKVILCAPCCHKQIRQQLKPTNILSLISRHGILLERQAEMLTDAIRARILEAYAYKTKVFEFISTEHTPKNVMIAGVLHQSDSEPDQSALEEVKQLKLMHGVEYHALEKMLGLM
ncbi:MAG: SAM-dependent methyltransferase [Bacteroidota bacterium]|nr:MAG: SAM-dependent methyltransferase [Bacteroidota bacterium]